MVPSEENTSLENTEVANQIANTLELLGPWAKDEGQGSKGKTKDGKIVFGLYPVEHLSLDFGFGKSDDTKEMAAIAYEEWLRVLADPTKLQDQELRDRVGGRLGLTLLENTLIKLFVPRD